MRGLAELYWCWTSHAASGPSSRVQHAELPVMLGPEPARTDSLILAGRAGSALDVGQVGPVGLDPAPELGRAAHVPVPRNQHPDVETGEQLEPLPVPADGVGTVRRQQRDLQ